MTQPTPSPSSAEPRWRYERKFEARGVALAEIEMRLRLHPAGFRTAHPARWINNLYLDRNDLRSFTTHVNGAPVRDKLRIRWYGAADGAIAAPVLEVKSKRGLVGAKAHHALPAFAFGPGFDFAPLRAKALARIADASVAEFVALAQPALFNRYHRQYLVSADGRFRLTIDTALAFAAPPGRALGPFARFEERDLTVLELKYAVACDGDAARVAGRLPFRLRKYSKYVQGVARLTGLEA
ncbi:MAG: hypothetical protein DCC71_05165 [Proteobacteria bacterium]|nr:MAG: hypothetical protein DCC71_05165 [Pseudomonadota bacterium]